METVERAKKRYSRPGFTGKFELNTALFKRMAQPDLYHEFGGIADSYEESANEWYAENKEPGDREGTYELDYKKALDVMTDIWVDLWNTYVKDKLPKVQAKAVGHWSPKEYNYRGDSGDFVVKLSVKEYDAICKRAMANPAFDKFLREYYSSYDGFISFYPDCLAEYIEEMNGGGTPYKDMDHYSRALVAAIHFIVFQGNEESFSDEYRYEVENIDFGELMRFVPSK